MAGKLLTDELTEDNESRVLANLLLPNHRVLLVPEKIWIDVFNRMYIGHDKDDEQRFDDLVYQYNYYRSESLPKMIVEQVQQSWEVALDRKISKRHQKRSIVNAVFGELKLEDVSTQSKIG